ncbi:MAG: SUMF1/EgtB/PvdO family nonheme iron enzyme [Deltaproteobacteria bacterium]|nr:SUMF1/EgtB/PvdO family nonheme iron enzyme [Deltaproteobacteria bacterium]
MKCPACGTENTEGTRFCGVCGNPLARVTAPMKVGVAAPAAPAEEEGGLPKIVGGQYEVKDKLGEGGMGMVLRGVHKLTGQEVAIKMLPPELSKDPGIRTRFINEAKTLAKLDHPNIVTLYNFLEENERFFLVMQFCPGNTLEGMVRKGGALKVEEAVRVFKDILGALSYAHARGVIHRDIKPANIIVQNDGRVKVMDFGIARIAGAGRLTATGIAVGTVWYMSPEQIRGAELDARSDLYSLGITLYEVLTGTVPFNSESDYEVRKGHVEEVPRSPRAMRPDLPEYVEKAILKSLAKKPEERFQSSEEFAKGLDDPNSMFSGAIPVVDPRKASVPPAPQAAAAAAPAPVTPAPVAQPVPVPPVTPAAGRTPQDDIQPSKSKTGLVIGIVAGLAALVAVVVVVVVVFVVKGSGTKGGATTAGSKGPRPYADTVPVTAGEFMMGSKTGKNDEAPPRKVFVPSFRIDKYEVTNEQYDKCVADKVCGENQKLPGQGNPKQPVVGVSWDDANTFCRWMGKRLPSEAEWERAAQPPKGEGEYPWGTFKPDCLRANFIDCDLKVKDVGFLGLGKSSFDVYDMAGNAAEWVNDWYDERAYSNLPNTNPKGPGSGTQRVYRGGHFRSSTMEIRKSTRMYGLPTIRNNVVGFRCAKDSM